MAAATRGRAARFGGVLCALAPLAAPVIVHFQLSRRVKTLRSGACGQVSLRDTKYHRKKDKGAANFRRQGNCLPIQVGLSGTNVPSLLILTKKRLSGKIKECTSSEPSHLTCLRTPIYVRSS